MRLAFAKGWQDCIKGDGEMKGQGITRDRYFGDNAYSIGNRKQSLFCLEGNIREVTPLFQSLEE